MSKKMEKLPIGIAAIFFVSLALNVFAASHFIRLFAGSYFSDSAHDYELREKLSDNDRRILESAVAINRGKMEALRSSINTAREKELAAARAVPFDQKALEAALEDERSRKMKALTLIHETRELAMGGMSPAGRDILKQMRRVGFFTPAEAARNESAAADTQRR